MLFIETIIRCNFFKKWSNRDRDHVRFLLVTDKLTYIVGNVQTHVHVKEIEIYIVQLGLELRYFGV